MCDFSELHERAVRLLDIADWDDVILDRLQVDCLRVRLVGDHVVVESVKHAAIIYRADMEGNPSRWNAQLLHEALDIMRKHMVLDDLADV